MENRELNFIELRFDNEGGRKSFIGLRLPFLFMIKSKTEVVKKQKIFRLSKKTLDILKTLSIIVLCQTV